MFAEDNALRKESIFPEISSKWTINLRNLRSIYSFYIFAFPLLRGYDKRLVIDIFTA